MRFVWEHNGNDTLLYSIDCIGAYARGESLDVAAAKLQTEINSYLSWKKEPAVESVSIEIVQEKDSDLQIADADSDVIFDAETKALSKEEYLKLKELVLQSARDFHTLYLSVPDKNKSCLPQRKTFYGAVPRTAEEMYEHTKNVNAYYFGEIGIDADNEGTIYECRKKGFELLERTEGFLDNPVIEGSYGELWSLRKMLRRFLWHDRIHAKAMYRMAVKTFGRDRVENVFKFISEREKSHIMFGQITPEKAGISSKKVLKFLKVLDKYNLSTHSFIMARGKDIFAEGYYAPFHKDYQHRMYSISKSFVGVAIGLAAEEGLLSLDDKFVKFFPEYVSEDAPKLLIDMTIREMLTMQTCTNNQPKWFYMGLEDRCEAYFKTPVEREAGTTWYYDSPGSFMLCCIVEKLTGKPFMEYLKEKFLLQAGFSENAYCLKSPGDHSFGDSGVMCTARDVLAFARFVMDGGTIDGVRYMDEAFLKEATKKQVSNSHGGEFAGGGYGYGYQIWKAPNDGFAFVGMGDQFAICDREKDFIFIITSDNQGVKDFSRAILYHELYQTIVDNLGEPLEEDAKAFGELQDYIAHLKLFSLRENTYSPLVEKINGKTFILDKNPMEMEWVRLEFDGDKGVLFYKNAQGEKCLPFGLGYNEFSKFPQTGYSDMVASVPEPGHMYDCAVSADWPEEQKLRIKVQIIDKYFGNMSMEFGFKGDKVGICMMKNAEAFLDEYQGYANGKMIHME